MITAIALDDEPLALRLLSAFAARLPYLRLDATFTHPADAIAHLVASPPDLIFLDIQMPQISGLQLARQLPPHTRVIFTTASAEHAVEGFNLQVADYLLKPFTPERFEQAVSRVRQQLAFIPSGKAESLFVKADNGMVRLFPDQILYLENVANYVKIHLSTGRYVLVRASMKALEETFRPNGFLRIHRSYIVPRARVTAVQGKTISLGGLLLPIGGSFESDVQAAFGEKLT